MSKNLKTTFFFSLHPFYPSFTNLFVLSILSTTCRHLCCSALIPRIYLLFHFFILQLISNRFASDPVIYAFVLLFLTCYVRFDLRYAFSTEKKKKKSIGDSIPSALQLYRSIIFVLSYSLFGLFLGAWWVAHGWVVIGFYACIILLIEKRKRKSLWIDYSCPFSCLPL